MARNASWDQESHSPFVQRIRVRSIEKAFTQHTLGHGNIRQYLKRKDPQVRRESIAVLRQKRSIYYKQLI